MTMNGERLQQTEAVGSPGEGSKRMLVFIWSSHAWPKWMGGQKCAQGAA